MFIRLLKNGFVNFWRNIWLSTAATLIMVITLTILTITMLFINLSTYAIKNVQERVDISVYFKHQVPEQQVLAVKSDLEQMSDVASVTYVSPEQGQEIFKQRHQNNQDLIAALNELDNPIPATLQIKAKQLNEYSQIATTLQNPKFSQYIDSVNYDDNRAIIERLFRILNITKRAGIVLAIVFSFIAVLVIFNTIRLTIYNRREEVEIMRLVGATNWYIQMPFFIESVMYATFAAIITMLLMLPFFKYIMPRIINYLNINPGQQPVIFYGIGVLFLMQLAIALALGIFSSAFAMRRYLRI